MNTHQTIRIAISQADSFLNMYLKDLSDADLLLRPVPGANHILWQLGHLVAGEHWMVSAIAPQAMPELPAGFSEKYGKETAGLDSASDFHTRAELLELLAKVRAGTFAALDSFSDADLDKPTPESLAGFLSTFGEVFVMVATHITMHTGQWAVIRRKLGHAPLI